MQRQAIVTSVSQLRKMANQMEKEFKDFYDGIGKKYDENTTFLVSIINKKNCSDTWELE